MKVQRYNTTDSMDDDEFGDFVEYEDYQKLEARITELEKQLKLSNYLDDADKAMYG